MFAFLPLTAMVLMRKQKLVLKMPLSLPQAMLHHFVCLSLHSMLSFPHPTPPSIHPLPTSPSLNHMQIFRLLIPCSMQFIPCMLIPNPWIWYPFSQNLHPTLLRPLFHPRPRPRPPNKTLTLAMTLCSMMWTFMTQRGGC